MYDFIFNVLLQKNENITKSQITEVLGGFICNPISTKTVRTILNYQEAYNYLQDHEDTVITLEDLRFYNTCVSRIDSPDAGTLRWAVVHIGEYVPPIIIESEVCGKLRDINEMSNDVDKAIECFIYICKAQLFITNNFTTALFAANHLLQDTMLNISPEDAPALYNLLYDYYLDDSKRDIVREFLLCHIH